ncbi:type II toxin-antitoxin system HipA family toxin [Stackebrandtia soli]|uniref:type II toxin-antitoxin system HipA family toxin n=1 Tax=Stackebrandtia soli TaxID=1892856 RepID=UPI0039E9F21A
MWSGQIESDLDTDCVTLIEKHHAVILYGHRIGVLSQRGDHVRFAVTEDYRSDPRRPVLGMRFEERLDDPYSAALRLPPWFSNLLPEGALRRWIADAGHVSADREMELLATIGHDLPGAVQVVPADTVDAEGNWEEPPGFSGPKSGEPEPWRFSLAGVAMKLSMLQRGDRLTVPAYGERGDWIVKLPDQGFSGVPHNEFAMMRFAAESGIDVPETRLVHREELPAVPDRLWPRGEEWAYAVKRFDRADDERRTPIHIEDFTQILDRYPGAKYEGSYETVGALIYRGRHREDLQEFARRLAFCVLIGNGDAHLKNWSMIYRDRLTARLAPVYDLVSTFVYRDDGDIEDLALKFNGGRRFDGIVPSSFDRLEQRLDSRFGISEAQLADVVSDLAVRARGALPEALGRLADEGSRQHLSDWFTFHSRGW